MMRDMILRHAHEGAEALHKEISGALGSEALENLMRARHVAVVPCIRNPGNADLARMTVAEELAKLKAAQGLEAEIADAADDLTGVADEGVTWRLSQAAAAAQMATRSGQQDTADYDVGDNGARMDRSERDQFAALMQQIEFSKKRR